MLSVKKKHAPSDSEAKPSLLPPPSPLSLFKLSFLALLPLLIPALCVGGGGWGVSVWVGVSIIGLVLNSLHVWLFLCLGLKDLK